MDYRMEFTPVGKPRMTQRDKWLNPPRAEVVRYRLAQRALEAYCMANHFTLGDEIIATFVLPMPNSWSEKKKKLMDGTPHQQKPDIDNILKFVADTLKPDGDQCIHSVVVKKVWGREGCVIFHTNDTATNEENA